MTGSRTPPGYRRVLVGGATVVARGVDLPLVEQALAAAGTLHRYAAAQPDALPLRGRGTAWAIPAGEGRWVVRHYQRGGAMAGALGDRYVRTGVTRAEAELHASEEARGRGIPTPRVIAAVAYPDGPFYRADLATAWIPDSADLAAVSAGAAAWPAPLRTAAWDAAHRLLETCFAAGLVHPDLNLRNVLVQNSSGEVTAYVLDLDRARLVDRVTPAQRARMEARFERSRSKLLPPPWSA